MPHASKLLHPPRSRKGEAARRAARLRCRPSMLALEDRRLLNGTPISAMSQYHSFLSGTPSGPVTLATFDDPAPAALGHAATIHWGDGTSSAGVVSADPVVANHFGVSGSHTYARPGVEFVSVSITNVSAGTSRTVSSVDPVVVPTPVVTAAAIPGLAVDGEVADVQVASFTDSDMGATPGTFSASIDWGDGESSGGVIAADPVVAGKFVVNASKPDAYAHAGSPTLKVTVSVAGGSPALTWVDAAGMSEALGSVSSTFANGLLYRMGGTTGAGHPTQSVASFDPATNSWTDRAAIPSSFTAVAATTAPDGRIVLLASDNDGGDITSLFYDPALDTWSVGDVLAVSPNGFAMTTGPDGRIYIVGGNDSGVASAKAYAYDPATGAFATLADLPTARFDLAAVTGPDGKIYALGGNDGTNTSTEIDAYDPTTGTWTQVGSLLRERALLVAALGPDGEIYAIGGYSNANGFGYDAEVYDPAANTSAAIQSLNGYRLYMNSSIGPDGRIYVMGGAGPTNQVSAYNAIDTKASDSIPLSVAKGTPSIHWDDPANIVVGTPSATSSSTPRPGSPARLLTPRAPARSSAPGSARRSRRRSPRQMPTTTTRPSRRPT